MGAVWPWASLEGRPGRAENERVPVRWGGAWHVPEAPRSGETREETGDEVGAGAGPAGSGAGPAGSGAFGGSTAHASGAGTLPRARLLPSEPRRLPGRDWATGEGSQRQGRRLLGRSCRNWGRDSGTGREQWLSPGHVLKTETRVGAPGTAGDRQRPSSGCSGSQVQHLGGSSSLPRPSGGRGLCLSTVTRRVARDTRVVGHVLILPRRMTRVPPAKASLLQASCPSMSEVTGEGCSILGRAPTIRGQRSSLAWRQPGVGLGGAGAQRGANRHAGRDNRLGESGRVLGRRLAPGAGAGAQGEGGS